MVFLLVTLGLSLWLGYQALDAAGSHRRTAEAALADYAGIAVWEYSRFVREGMDSFYRWVFDDVPWRLRRRPPEPDVMENDLRSFLRSQRCECRDLRDGAWFFRVDLTGGASVTYPDSLPGPALDAAAEALRTHLATEAAARTGVLAIEPDAPGVRGTLAVYMITADEDEVPLLAYGVAAETGAFDELFLHWYRSAPLLPTTIAGTLPTDSILQIAVSAPGESPFFTSPVPYPGTFSSSDTLEADYGSLVVGASIRPDAASQLIIGGLPRSRIPLLLGLMILTLGVGAAALVQLRREHQLARLRDDFISGVSHEFRTPLTQIRVFAELLDDEKLRTPEERKRSTRVINREARRLTHLVENILQFSRVSRFPTSMGDLEEIDIEDALGELSEAFAPQAEGRGTTLRISVPPDLLVVAGRGGLYRILANLLDNALKYGPAGQTVDVRAGSVDAMVRIQVEDEGPGIPPRDRRRIWDPYRRLDRDVAGEVQGSGIGLAVVKDLCSAYGGRVWVEEGERGGALFVVELPAAEARGDSPGSATPAASASDLE